MHKNLLQNNLLLHLTVLIFGFTGILGKLITVEGTVLVWYRTAIASATMLLIILVARKKFRIDRKTLGIAILTGWIVAGHWVTFFQSIKMANVSIALACLSVATLFVAFIQPLLFKTGISVLEIITGLIIIGGITLILNVEFDYLEGILVGLCSAMLSGLFTVINKKITERGDGFVISFIEIISGFTGLSFFFLITGDDTVFQPLPATDWLYLGLLGTVCTAFAFYAVMRVLRVLSAYHVVLAINLEPIYGFVLAAIFFGENKELDPGFYIGAAIIILAVSGYSLWKSKVREKILNRIKKS